jgi:hypothetical protein
MPTFELAAATVGQNLVDNCLIAHVDEDQPFIDGPRLYRFVEREAGKSYYFFLFCLMLKHIPLTLHPILGLLALLPPACHEEPQWRAGLHGIVNLSSVFPSVLTTMTPSIR